MVKKSMILVFVFSLFLVFGNYAKAEEIGNGIVRNGTFAELVKPEDKPDAKGKIIGDKFPKHWILYTGEGEVIKKNAHTNTLRIKDGLLFQGLYTMKTAKVPQQVSLGITAYGKGQISVRFRSGIWKTGIPGADFAFTENPGSGGPFELSEKPQTFYAVHDLKPDELSLVYIEIGGEAFIDNVFASVKEK